jgi:hypothetical protein
MSITGDIIHKNQEPTWTAAAPADITQSADRVACSTCHSIIGCYWPVDVHGKSRVMLKIGCVILESAHGKCACGAEWHWCYTDRMLADLISRRTA